MLKGVPRFVSKGQHSRGGALVSELLGWWTGETLGAHGVPWVPDRLPYGPRRLFAAGRRLRTPRGVAPWRAAPGRVAAARRRVPAGSSTIPARRESTSRLGRPAPAARRPLPQGAGGGAPAPSPKQSLLVQPRSARRRQARARASRRLLELRGTRPPRTPLHPLVPPLHSQVCARPDCPCCSRILKDRLPPPRPPRRPPGVWLATRKNWPLGCSGSPGPGVRPGRLPPALCVRAAKLSEEPPLRRRSQKRDDQGTIGGPKATVLTGGDPGKLLHPGFPVAWSRPPASPPLQGQSKPGRGGARPLGRASGAAGKGLWLVLVFAKPVWERNRESRGEEGRPVSAREINLVPGPGVRFCF